MRLDGTKVMLSGKFGRSRDELESELKARGAILTNDLAPDVEVIFAGEDAGSEVDAALELGVRVADDAELKAALTGTEPPPKPLAPEPAEPAAPASTERVFEKGAQVRIVGGREGVGQLGEIFWWGDSKFGDGMRAGVSAEDGEKYWVDEENLAWPDADIDEEALEEAIAANVFGRGDRVRVKSGKEEGAEGTIFWWGESKFGDGMRAGMETDDGEKLWVDAEHLAPADDDEDESDIPF